MRIGRDRNCDVVLEHDRVSRRHTELRKSASGGTTIVDLSSNGTFVRKHSEWVRIGGSIDITTPVTIRIAHSVRIEEFVTAPAVEEPAEQTWEQSVMIPVASLGQRTEAILVFDLCESALIASKNDHLAYHMKQRLTQIADPILGQYGRRFFKSTGDGFLATFEDPTKALQAAVKIEDHFQLRNERTSNEPIHYRIALHFGDVWAISAGGDDVHGNDANITFRIEGVEVPAFDAVEARFPKRDRILCSGRFHKVAGENKLGLPTSFVHCGAATLRGIINPVEIYWMKTQYSREDIDLTLAIGSVPRRQ